MRIALFDIDGTLLDSHGAGRRAVARALRAELGVDLDKGLRLDGKTDPQIVGEALESLGHPAARDATSIDAVCRRYLSLLPEELAGPSGGAAALPGVVPLLSALEAEPQVLLGLLTGNLAQGARLKLESAGIAFGRFRVGAFGSDSPDRLALPAVARERAAEMLGSSVQPSHLVVIGDTPADVRCGRESGARTIAVTTGRYGASTLLAAGADHVFATFEPAESVLQAILA